jgi:hypothetical protein
MSLLGKKEGIPNKSTTAGPTSRRKEVTRSQRSMRPPTPHPSNQARKKRVILLCVNKRKQQTRNAGQARGRQRNQKRRTKNNKRENAKGGENNDVKRSQVSILTRGALV